MSEIKVGDVVAWADVPDGALVRSKAQTGWTCFYRRAGDFGDVAGLRRGPHDAGVFWPASEQLPFWRDVAVWKGWCPDDHSVTVVALGLTGQESADDLRRLAEVFEVREAVCAFIRTSGEVHAEVVDFMFRERARGRCTAEEAATRAAEHLHALGWRKGMTAEDAARLLAAAGAP